LLHPPCYTRLVFLACARCFGKLLWVAAFGSDFGEHLWETIMERKFAALQQHCKERWLAGFFLEKKIGKLFSEIILGEIFVGSENIYSVLFLIIILGSGFRFIKIIS
jgi:hypothetical protein